MPILPLHASLDFHDGIAVVILALTLALGSFLSSLRRRQQRPAPPEAHAATPSERRDARQDRGAGRGGPARRPVSR